MDKQVSDIQKYYQNEPKFIGVYSRNNLPKIKDGAYVLDLNEYKSVWTHWLALYVNGDNGIYFHSFRLEHIPKEIKKFIGNRNIETNNFRVEAFNSVLVGFFCIAFTDFMLKDKSLFEYINFFSPNDYEKIDKIVLKNFQ